MAVFPIASSMINGISKYNSAIPKKNIIRQAHTIKPACNFGSKVINSPKFQKLLNNFLETIKIMKGIK